MTSPTLPAWHPARLTATWFGTGYLPIAPGTWASGSALVVAWPISAYFGPVGLVVAAIIAFAAGLWATAVMQRRTGAHDPRWIVIDEVAGQWLALAPVAPLDPVHFAIGFFSFRLFDIFKPWPANWCDQRLPGAPGVMLDDIVAGIYAAAVVYAADILNLNFGLF